MEPKPKKVSIYALYKAQHEWLLLNISSRYYDHCPLKASTTQFLSIIFQRNPIIIDESFEIKIKDN